MTDERLITNFIEKNYSVQLSTNFKIYDKVFNITMDFNNFYEEIEIIIGKFGKNENSVKNIVKSWVNNKKRNLVRDLDDFVKKLDLTKGFDKACEVLLIKFGNEWIYDRGFMINYLSDYYNETILLPKLLLHIEYLKNIDVNLLSFDKTISDFEKEMTFEGFKQREFVREFLINWYKDSVIDEKLNDLFSQLVVTLGPRNWKVTWIGHGELTRPKLESIFGSQSPSIYEYIKGRYDVWFDNAIEKAAEKLISKNYGGF